MRIRSIKPEFWRSEDIAALPWEVRLLFIGLWSYVDDNGVGRDDERIIRAELFALDEDLSESSLRVHGGLKLLHARNLIDRYTVQGKPFLHIRTWDRHQKINRPSPGRYPLPTCGNAEIHEPLTEDSVSPHHTLRAGTGEQGNRGTGDTPTGAAAPAAGKTPEQAATTNAYERVGKAFKFVAVLQIAKWAIHDRNEDPQIVEDAIVSVYEMGKPITRQTIGQYLDGHLARPSSRPPDMSRQDAKVLGYLEAGRRITQNTETPKGIA